MEIAERKKKYNTINESFEFDALDILYLLLSSFVYIDCPNELVNFSFSILSIVCRSDGRTDSFIGELHSFIE